MMIVKFLNAPINPTLLQEQLAPLGLVAELWAGFTFDGRLYQPTPAPRVIASSPAGDVIAQPGELQIRGDVDPGKTLDNLLADHDPRLDSTEDLKEKTRQADRETVTAALALGTPMTPDDLKAVARLALGL